MPKLTNTKGLPAGLVRAIEADPYDAGDSQITASSIGNPPQLETLKRKHADEIEEDASDRIWSLLGQAAHVIMERGAAKLPDGLALSEVRLSMDVLGWKLSGALDHYSIEDGVLSDLKITSAWTIVYGDRIEEWQHQLGVLATLLENAGHEVKRLEIIAILRDWAARDVGRVKDYPTSNVVVVPLELWPRERRLAYIKERIMLHQAARSGQQIDCTDEERWAKRDKKTGATKYVRCESYCVGSKWCSQLAEGR